MPAHESTTPPSDFDFTFGSRRVYHRRLNARLYGRTEWTVFEAHTTTRKILQGFGNVEDNRMRFPDGDVRAAALRSYDPTTRSWSISWLNGQLPHQLDVPVVGGFTNGVGQFVANDVLDGRPIVIRFLWYGNAGRNPTWEQAFSDDAGATWETNWTMEFARADG